ncbi:unnamed protein product [Closterium sp. NIES-54]
MHGRHGGKEMAKAVEEVVVQWGLQGHCLGLTTDNASSNIATCRRLSVEGDGQGFFKSRMHFMCLSHVINLAVQLALSVKTIREVLHMVREMASWIEGEDGRSAPDRPALGDLGGAEGGSEPLQQGLQGSRGDGVPDSVDGGAVLQSRLHKGPSGKLCPLIVTALGHLKKYAYITSNEYWIATLGRDRRRASHHKQHQLVHLNDPAPDQPAPFACTPSSSSSIGFSAPSSSFSTSSSPSAPTSESSTAAASSSAIGTYAASLSSSAGACPATHGGRELLTHPENSLSMSAAASLPPVPTTT